MPSIEREIEHLKHLEEELHLLLSCGGLSHEDHSRARRDLQSIRLKRIQLEIKDLGYSVSK
jgi:hypothetical protein